MLPPEIGNRRLSQAARLAVPLVFTLGGVTACGPSRPEGKQLLPARPASPTATHLSPTISFTVADSPPLLSDQSVTAPPPDSLASATFSRPAQTPVVAFPYAAVDKPTDVFASPVDAAFTVAAPSVPPLETAVTPATSSLPQNTRPAAIPPIPPVPPQPTNPPTETTLPQELTRIGQTLEDQKQTPLDELLDKMISVYGVHVTDGVEAGIGEPFDIPATGELKRLVVATFHSMPDVLKEAAKKVYQSSGTPLIIRLQIANEAQGFFNPQATYSDGVIDITVPNSLALSPLEKPVAPDEPLSDSEKLVQEIMYGLGQAHLDIQSKQPGVMPIALQWATQFYQFWLIGPDQQTLQKLETIFGRPIKNNREHIAASLARLALYRFSGLSNDLNPFAIQHLFPGWLPGEDYLKYIKKGGQ